MSYKAVKIFNFCSTHRVLGHEGKCANLHGHNYKAEIFAKSDRLDDLGRVIDFSVIKETIGEFIDKEWDHTAIIYKEDYELSRALASTDLFPNKPPYLFGANPTAENLARFLLLKANDMLINKGVTVSKIRLWETETCYAEVEL